MAIKLWSPRSETKASALPLGDHCGSELRPRAITCSGLATPSRPASQIWPSFTYATPLPRGEICGESPVSILLGAPPPQLTTHMACSTPAGLLVGLGTNPAPFLFPPRTYTIVFASGEKLSSPTSCPSSSSYVVSWRGVNCGPSATQMFRRP